jgi:hypothetical protein
VSMRAHHLHQSTRDLLSNLCWILPLPRTEHLQSTSAGCASHPPASSAHGRLRRCLCAAEPKTWPQASARAVASLIADLDSGFGPSLYHVPGICLALSHDLGRHGDPRASPHPAP